MTRQEHIDAVDSPARREHAARPESRRSASSQPRISPVFREPNGRISPCVAPRWRSASPILDPQQLSAALCAPQSPNPDAGHLSQISICGAMAGRPKRGMSELPWLRLGLAPPRARSRAAGGRLRLTNWAPRPPLHAVSARHGGEAGRVARATRDRQLLSATWPTRQQSERRGRAPQSRVAARARRGSAFSCA